MSRKLRNGTKQTQSLKQINLDANLSSSFKVYFFIQIEGNLCFNRAIFMANLKKYNGCSYIRVVCNYKKFLPKQRKTIC